MEISIKNLSKTYTSKPSQIAKGLFGIRENRFALQDISFDIKKGESVGIIGENGSGKSTLLKILAGVTAPTSGEIKIKGNVSSLLELGAGFNSEYNGISNIYLNGMIHGETRAETRAKINEIAKFSGIGDYLKRPVKTYSDGMFLRLAFSCAIAVNSDILIIDEALAVGDFAFQQKCFNKIKELKNSGVTIILVSHDIDTVRRFCERAIWLKKGKIELDGDIEKVSAKYMESITGIAGRVIDIDTINNISSLNRFGSAIGSITDITYPKNIETGSKINIITKLDIPDEIPLNGLCVSLSIKDRFGLDICVLSTADIEGFKLKHGKQIISFNFICPLCQNKYSLSAALENRNETPIKYYDYAENIGELCVSSKKDYFGLFRIDAKVKTEEK